MIVHMGMCTCRDTRLLTVVGHYLGSPFSLALQVPFMITPEPLYTSAELDLDPLQEELWMQECGWQHLQRRGALSYTTAIPIPIAELPS